MRILISAFACAPSGGSEGGVGWHWARALAADGHDVSVLTDVTRRAAIDRAMASRAADTGAPGTCPQFLFYRPKALRRVRLNRRTAQLLYSGWQYGLYAEARRLHRERRFDLVIHLTYGVFRHPSFLGLLDAPFVFGPVGGGEEAPWRLKAGLPIREKAKEIARAALNVLARCNPLLNLALLRTDLVLAKTQDTADALPRHVRRRTRVLLEIGLDPATLGRPAASSATHVPGEPFQVLFVGRLIGVKGIDLLLESFAEFAGTRPLATLTMVGSGPLAGWVDVLARQLGIRSRITMVNHLPQHEVFDRYRRAHVLLFPSLHDSSGNVVLEALHHAVPVVCLDLGGPPGIIDSNCGLAIEARQASRQTVIASLAAALARLHDDEPLRQAMSGAAAARAEVWSWRSRVRAALAMAHSAGLIDKPVG